MKAPYLSANLSSVVFSLALVVLSLYMVGMSTSDWLARYALAGNRANEFTGRICRSLPGCQSISAQSMFNWREARRYVSYEISGTRIDNVAATDAIKRAADDTGGLLGFAVKTPFWVNVRNNPARKGQ